MRNWRGWIDRIWSHEPTMDPDRPKPTLGLEKRLRVGEYYLRFKPGTGEHGWDGTFNVEVHSGHRD